MVSMPISAGCPRTSGAPEPATLQLSCTDVAKAHLSVLLSACHSALCTPQVLFSWHSSTSPHSHPSILLCEGLGLRCTPQGLLAMHGSTSPCSSFANIPPGLGCSALSTPQVHHSMLHFFRMPCRLGDSQQQQQGSGSSPEVEMVILRFSLELCSPGCMHFVLESVSPKPPYLLENRTAHPFRYRQSMRQGAGAWTCFIIILASWSIVQVSKVTNGMNGVTSGTGPPCWTSAMCSQMSLMHRTELAGQRCRQSQELAVTRLWYCCTKSMEAALLDFTAQSFRTVVLYGKLAACLLGLRPESWLSAVQGSCPTRHCRPSLQLGLRGSTWTAGLGER